MAINVINNTKADPWIPEDIAQRALGKLEDNLYLAQNVARDTEFNVQNQGDKIIVGKRGTLSRNAKTAGSSVTFQNPTASKVEVSLDQHYEVTVNYDDIMKTQVDGRVSIDDGYMEDAILTLAEGVETDLAGLATGFSQTSGSQGVDVDEDAVLSLRKTLTQQKAPRSNRFLYLDPAQINVALKLDRFTAVEKYGPNASIAEGELGKIHGFRVFESNFVKAAGSPTTYYNIAMHKDAIILATRPIKPPNDPYVSVGYAAKDGLVMRVLKAWNSTYLCDQVTIDMLYGYSELRDEFGVQLLT
jgi:N4-gp56 family major capsid protein